MFVQANWHIKIEKQRNGMVPSHEQTCYYNNAKKLVQDYNESDVDNKVQILYKMNSLIPRMYRINIPSLITDDFIDTVLYQIEKSIHWL